jgi:hypothetical protein
VDDVDRFYKTPDQHTGTHLALRWNGRVRFTVPRDAAGQKACWKLFHPGRLEFPLRAIARLPRLLGAVSCVEADNLALIREAIGNEAGLSCCRAGAPGPWSKDTILFLDNKTTEPVYVVKAGAGEAVDRLLQNDAKWLRVLRDLPALAGHVPNLVAHHSGSSLSFVAVTPLLGKLDYTFGELHVAFLRKFQDFSRQTMRLEESTLYLNLRSRLKDISGLLSESWSTRLDIGMRRIEQSLSGPPILLVAAHNDFTLWNIRVECGVARIFDWEYADYEQFPLFDPLHFALMPMALRRQSTARMVQCISQTLQMSQQRFGKELCYEAQTQVLAYLVNLCTLYLWSVHGASESHPVLDSYAAIIDHLCSCKSVL